MQHQLRMIIGALILAAGGPSLAQAVSAVHCVQQQLTKAAADNPAIPDPNGIDGAIGAGTKRSYAALRATKANLPATLTRQNAGAVCKALGGSYTSTQSGAGFGGEYNWRVDKNVPSDQVDFIRRSLVMAERHFAAAGLTADEFDRSKVTIKVVNKGAGASGFCCALQASTARKQNLFFDVAHRNWAHSVEQGRAWFNRGSVLHELWHAVQYQLGGKNMPNWMFEGQARFMEFYAYDRDKPRQEQLRNRLAGAILGEQMAKPLKTYRDHNQAWPGDVGALALYGLFQKTGQAGPPALLRYNRLVGRKGHKRAFEQAFNYALDDFYEQVEAWRQRTGRRIQANPVWSK